MLISGDICKVVMWEQLSSLSSSNQLLYLSSQYSSLKRTFYKYKYFQKAYLSGMVSMQSKIISINIISERQQMC
jgi:hypothetical protein